ncbi:MAG: ABC transporter substrate-binding protein [Oscillibacter sp.]|nr:ABC transporter substrate-binding protein [Oscillibacter sp.]
MKKLLLALVLSAAMLCALLTGCGGGETPAPDAPSDDGAPAHPDELFVGIAQDLDSLDPHKMVAAGTKEIMFNVFEGLVKPAPSGDLIPALAESWTVSDDARTYAFALRPNVKFHNGAIFTSADALYSIRRLAGLDDAENSADVVAVDAFSNLAAIDAPDETTLVLRLREPSNEFLSYLTAAVIPADYAEQDTAPVGTGPFRFVSRTAQESVVLERFDDYWGAPAAIKTVTCRIIENADSILMSLQSGAVDLFAHLTITQAQQLGDGFRVEQGAMNLVQALYLNNAVEPFNDIRVRQALCHAVDKQAILDLAFDGYGFPIGSSMYPAFSKYFDETLTDFYPHDVEKAKQLLADAGYPDGFSMSITVPSNYQPHLDAAQVIAEQLKEIGVQANILPVEWETWLNEAYLGRNFESTVIGVDASAMTARALLERFTSTASNNFINYNNEEYDNLFAEAQSLTDDAAQTAAYRAMERNLTENAANVYIQDMADLLAVRNGLEGIQFYPIYVLDLYGLRWETA